MQLFINIYKYLNVHNNNNCHLSETITVHELKPETVILFVLYNLILLIIIFKSSKFIFCVYYQVNVSYTH